MEGEGIVSLSSSSRSRRSLDIISILLVDDDTTSLAVVAGMLKQFKYNVVTVKNPKDALITLRTKNGLFDLVLTDLHMPDMNGIDLLQVISEEFDLPVILMSADDNDCIVLQGLENGAVFFISKPVCPEDLRDLWQFAAMKQSGKGVGEQTDEATNPNDIVASASSSSSSSSASDDENLKKNKDNRKASRNQESREDTSQSASNKKPKVVWNNALHSRFLDAIRSIGLERAVPKKILEVMNEPGLTRENVASHLQKYRIFLRRVSNASININSYSRNKIFRCFAASDLTVPPEPSFVPNMQNPNFGDGNPSSSRNPFQQPSFNRNYPIIPNSMIGSSSTATMVSGASCGVTLQENNGANVSQNFAPYQSNYVGFSISSIRRMTELGQTSGSKASAGGLDHENNGAGLVGPGEDITGLHQFGDVHGPSPALDPLLGSNENGFGRFGDPSLSPLIDISDLCHILNGPLDLAAEVNYRDADTANQVNYLKNPQTQSGFDNTVMSYGFSVGSSSNWMNNQVPNLDQAANQHVRAMSSLHESTQVNERFMLPLVNEPQQAQEVVANNNLNDHNMANANLNHNNQNMANVNLIDQNMANNDFEIDHEGFMESFYASFNYDNPTLDGL